MWWLSGAKITSLPYFSFPCDSWILKKSFAFNGTYKFACRCVPFSPSAHRCQRCQIVWKRSFRYLWASQHGCWELIFVLSKNSTCYYCLAISPAPQFMSLTKQFSFCISRVIQMLLKSISEHFYYPLLWSTTLTSYFLILLICQFWNSYKNRITNMQSNVHLSLCALIDSLCVSAMSWGLCLAWGDKTLRKARADYTLQRTIPSALTTDAEILRNKTSQGLKFQKSKHSQFKALVKIMMVKI